ncbi:MAG: hypothetical protein UR26_C0003G0008 [candidate division TM6 bacterium GW2011_GWF2_32_72]|nr:MAG: hypothetical protein UR26_C0003G0008 [candidate division TM6 bacterium GW2011_GWF2_32_72]
MNKMLKFSSLAVLLSLAVEAAASCNLNPVCCIDSVAMGKSVFSPRSQTQNVARRLVGWQSMIHKADQEKFYGSFNLAAEYSRSFRSKKIAEYLFGTDRLTFMGSQSPNFQAGKHLIADHFGLSHLFEGAVEFAPKITNVMGDFSLFIGLDKWSKGWYLKFNAPLVYSKWSLGMSECCGDLKETANDNGLFFPIGYMTGDLKNDAIPFAPIDTALSSITTALSGCGDVVKFKHGKFIDSKSIFRLAEIRGELGWNFLLNENYNLGLGVMLSAPTGNKRTGKYIFEPVAGNGKHWEIGATANGYLKLWESSKNMDRTLSLFFDGNVSHLFYNKETRALGLDTVTPCNGGCDMKSCLKGMNRYMLLKSFSLNNNLATPVYQYTGVKNAIDFVSQEDNVNVSVDVAADVAAKLAYSNGGLQIDLGYNFWCRSKENVINLTKENCDTEYGLKGTGGVAIQVKNEVENEEEELVPSSIINGTSRLDSTYSNATIACPGSLDNPKVYGTTLKDPNPTTLTGDITGYTSWDQTTAVGLMTAEVDSVTPVFIDVTNLDTSIATSPSAMSHKIFTHINFNWNKVEHTPYLGAGLEFEFDHRARSSRSSINQWGFWIKGGFNF